MGLKTVLGGPYESAPRFLKGDCVSLSWISGVIPSSDIKYGRSLKNPNKIIIIKRHREILRKDIAMFITWVYKNWTQSQLLMFHTVCKLLQMALEWQYLHAQDDTITEDYCYCFCR
jgi:hypothetical protein